MNDTPIRKAYDEWRRRNRIRHSEARWDAFSAGFMNATNRFPEMAELDALPEPEREWVLATLRAAIDTAKDRPLR
jgi:DNA-directed RNA polymerase specialized sigma24 family protein